METNRVIYLILLFAFTLLILLLSIPKKGDAQPLGLDLDWQKVSSLFDRCLQMVKVESVRESKTSSYKAQSNYSSFNWNLQLGKAGTEFGRRSMYSAATWKTQPDIQLNPSDLKARVQAYYTTLIENVSTHIHLKSRINSDRIQLGPAWNHRTPFGNENIQFVQPKLPQFSGPEPPMESLSRISSIHSH